MRTAYEQRANSVRTTREPRTNNARTAYANSYEQRANYARTTRELRARTHPRTTRRAPLVCCSCGKPHLLSLLDTPANLVPNSPPPGIPQATTSNEKHARTARTCCHCRLLVFSIDKPKERREAPTCCRETAGSRLRRDVPHILLKALVGKVTRLVEMCHHATPVARTR